jgi:hypothetical protein
MSPEPPPTLPMPAACCLAKMADLGLRLQAGPCRVVRDCRDGLSYPLRLAAHHGR